MPKRPQTAAEQRAAEVRANRGPRVPKPIGGTARSTDRDTTWVDEGPIRSAAVAAAQRAQIEEAPRRQRPTGELDPEVVAEVEREAGLTKAGRYRERLQSAFEALERGRFDDAKRMVQPVLRDVPNVAAAHEVAGLALYSMGQWRKAAAELEIARTLDHSVRHHPVLADCYRAMRRYHEVAQLWTELKEASPDPALMAEGRIVAAGALADQGDLRGALEVMAKSREVPKKVHDHHLRQWYVIGDLLDRSGDIVEARRFFGMVAQQDREFADVMQRLASLGR